MQLSALIIKGDRKTIAPDQKDEKMWVTEQSRADDGGIIAKPLSEPYNDFMGVHEGDLVKILPYGISNVYRINSYRVLLTRGRDDFIVFVPPIHELDPLYSMMRNLGIKELGITEIVSEKSKAPQHAADLPSENAAEAPAPVSKLRVCQDGGLKLTSK